MIFIHAKINFYCFISQYNGLSVHTNTRKIIYGVYFFGGEIIMGYTFLGGKSLWGTVFFSGFFESGPTVYADLKV